jgi:glycine oxidase
MRRLEPAAAHCIISAIRSPLERHIEPRLLVASLSAACRHQGVQQSFGKVTGLESESDRVVAVQTDTARFSCKTLVIASGAWSELLGPWLGVDIPVKPLRGQILALGPSKNPLLQHTLYTHGAYLVPRRDGRVVAGATEESVGFETQTTAYGIAALLGGAESLVPALADQPLHSAWTGLRPLSADGLPLLGRVGGWENVHIATGHGRNGILLAPITGALMANSILNDATLPEAFNPSRFGDTL